MAVSIHDLPLIGMPNFRDFGGYEAADGRCVRRGLLYRSQAFAGATTADLKRLAGLGIRLVCDLRSELERKTAADLWPDGTLPPRLYLDIRNDARAGQHELIDTIRADPTRAGVRRGMLMIYRGMPAAFAGVLPRLFEHLLDPRHLPMVIHCHAGKDRTGFLCAVILAALGVSRHDVLRDYLVTAERLDRVQMTRDLVDSFSHFVGVPLTEDALQPALEVHPEYLDAALGALDADHGGIEGYLQSVAGLGAAERETLRANLLA